MRHLFLILTLVLMSFAAYAQTASEETAAADSTSTLLQRRLGHLRMNKQKLSDPEKVWVLSNINGADRNAEWDKYLNNRNVGAGLMFGGYSVAALSGTAAFIYVLAGVLGGTFAAVITGGDEEATNNATKDAFNTAGILGGVTLGAAAIGTAGLPLLIVNGRKMSKIVDDYNADPQHNLLPAPGGEQPALTVSLIPASKPVRPGVRGQGGAFFGIGLGVNF